MTVYDLRKNQLTLEELFQAASDETIQVVTKNGATFIIEPADEFDREVMMLGQSATFRTFIAERKHEQANISLDTLEAEIEAEILRNQGQ